MNEWGTEMYLRIIVLILCCGAACAQSTSSGRQVPPKRSSTTEKKSLTDVSPSHPWLERARLITAEVEHDIPRLGPYDAALVNARLAQIWWKRDNPARLRQWLDFASAAVTRVPANESSTERQQRLEAGYEIVTITVPLDRKEAKRIGAELSKTPINDTDASSSYRASAAMERAVYDQALRGDPNVAAQLISEDLKDGGHLWNQDLALLRFKSPELADRVFREALETVPANHYNPQTIHALMADAYPEQPSPELKGPPEGLRQAALRLLAQAALRVPQNEIERQSVCANASQAVHWLDRFSQQQAAAVQSIFDGCNSNAARATSTSPGRAEVDCHQVGARECLRLAEAEPDANRRATLRLNALFAADESDHDPELAITIYKSLSKEEHEKAPDLELMMLNPYANLGEKYLKENDPNSFYSMLNDVNGSLRLRLQMIFASEFLDQSKTAEGVALLAEARATLARTGSNDTGVYLQLANMYARYLPADAPYVLRETVEGLNGIEAEAPKRSERDRAPAPADRMRPIRMSPAFLDIDPSVLSETLNSLDSVRMRQRLQLGLLQAALLRDQQQGEGAKAPGQQPGPIK